MTKFIFIAATFLGVSAEAFEFTKLSLPAPEFYEYATPASVDLDEEKLQKFIAKAADKNTGALLIIRKNKLVVEKYWRADNFEYPLQSISKTLTSLAVGCLVEEGKLSLEDPVQKWFKDWTDDKSKVTIRHLLTHTSGLQENTDDMEKSKNQLKFSLELPLSNPPGEEYFYSEAGSLILSDIVRQVADTPIDEYVNQRLFKPLGIRRWTWKKDPSGTLLGNGGAAMTPRELIKIGMMLLQKGRWQDHEVIPTAYLEKALQPSPRKESYGFLINLIPNGFFAAGKYGQFLVVLPKHEMVVVRLRTPEKGEENLSDMHWVNMPRELKEFVIKPPVPVTPPTKSSKKKKN